MTAERKLMHELVDDADLLDAIENGVYDIIGELDGITILERREREKDRENQYRCHKYTFGVVKKEPWVLAGFFTKKHRLWTDTLKFLGEKGYDEVVQPENGDIVAYTCNNGNGTMTGHFGIYEDGKVTSKFNVGHIFVHEIHMVPASYGNSVTYFRRNGKAIFP